jgi:hypothetical protein
MRKNLTRLILGAVLLAGSVILTLSLHWADFHVYYSAGISLLKGRTDLYAADFADSAVMDYRYPPFFLVLFLPFTQLPYQAAEFVWLWLNLAILYFTVVAMRRGMEIINLKTPGANVIFLVSLLICAKYFIVSMRILNVHLIVLCLVFGAFYLLLRQKQTPAALLMALAITFKIVPVLTLPYFFIKKQWRFLAMTFVFVAAFNLLPALYYGFDANSKMLADWYRHVMVNNDFHDTNGPINASLEGQLARYLTEIDYTQRLEDPDYERINFASLSENAVSVIAKIISLLMLAATLLIIWFAAKARNDMPVFNLNERHNNFESTKSTRFDSFAYHEFGLIICLMLLIEPRTNVYYFLALFVPLIAFLVSLWRRRSKFNISAFCLILAISCVLPLVPGRGTQRLLLVHGVDFYLTLVVWIAVGYNIIAESASKKDKFTEFEYNR